MLLRLYSHQHQDNLSVPKLFKKKKEVNNHHQGGIYIQAPAHQKADKM